LKTFGLLQNDGFVVTDAVGRSRRCHTALFSYVADMPEASDLCGTVHTHCVRGYKPRTLRRSNSWRPRNVGETLKYVRALRAAASATVARKTEEAIRSMGMSSVRPALCGWPFMTLHPGLDLYNVYRFESLRNFYLGTFRTLLLALSSMLKSDRMETAAFLDSRRRYRKLKSARTEVLRRCNSALAAMDSDSPCVGLNFDFTKKGSTETVSGLFTAKGLRPCSMLASSRLSLN
jgi:hypothetical protein